MRDYWKALARIPWVAWLSWCVWTLAGAAMLTHVQLDRLNDAFQTDARIVHRLLSQRAAQHDALVNALALLQPGAQVGDAPETRLPALFPQVIAVHRRGPDQTWADPRMSRAEQDSRTQQRAVLAGVDMPHGRFDLVRAATPANYALTINLSALADADWPMDRQISAARVALEYKGAQHVIQPGARDVELPDGWRLAFRKTLGSESQHFDVVAQQRLGWAQLPWSAMAAWAASGALIWWGAASWLRQRAARQRAEELLRLGQVARLNTLGELAAGIAHELNQPLTAVLAGTQASVRLLDEEVPELPVVRQAMRQVVAQARRAADVLARLRRIIERPAEHPASPSPAVVDMADAARRALTLLRPEIDRLNVHASLQADASVLAQADSVAVEQILHNLLANALHALTRVPDGQRRLALHTSIDGGRAHLSVADSGPGINPEVMAHIFEPFFTTREDGLGLGLSLCETLAGSQGGALTVAPNPSGGAVFTLTLPQAPQQA